MKRAAVSPSLAPRRSPRAPREGSAAELPIEVGVRERGIDFERRGLHTRDGGERGNEP